MMACDDLRATLQPKQLTASIKPQQFGATLQATGPAGPQGPPGPQGAPGITQPFRLGHTWGLLGDVSGITTLPSMFIPLRSGQASVLASLRSKITFGTSINAQVKRNGANVGGIITITTIAATTSLGNLTLADNDELTVVLSSPIGAPTDLGMTLILEHTP
jgi:hypothetical protein